MLKSSLIYRNVIPFVFLLTFLNSCNKDESPEEQLQLSEISNVEIDISDISITSVEAKINLTSNSTNLNLLTKTVLYKTSESNEFSVAKEGIIENLTPGKKYTIKAVIEWNGNQKESNAIEFITLGFKSELLSGHMSDFNSRQYRIFNSGRPANFTEVNNLQGYIKVDQDSLQLESISVIDNNIIDITLPENLQFFFRNDAENVFFKEFTIGLLSGDYYIEVSEARGPTGNKVWPEGASFWTIYNKTPAICENPNLGISLNSCGNQEKIQFSISGGFSIMGSSIYNDTSLFKEISIILNNKNAQNSDVLTLLTAEDRINGQTTPCDVEAFRIFQTADVKSRLNNFNSIRFELLRNKYPNGSYQVQFIGIDYDDVEWPSNIFDFEIQI